MIYGACTGDIIGSPYEFRKQRAEPDFPLFNQKSRFTDDTVQTLAVADAILTAIKKPDFHSALRSATRSKLQEYAIAYPYIGYGYSFEAWCDKGVAPPYGSLGNGAGMRVSPAAWAATSLNQALDLSDIVTSVTHNHPEGIKGARAITAAIYLARAETSKDTIRTYIQEYYYPNLLTLEEIQNTGIIPDATCPGSVPHAIEAFLESTDFEDCIRKAVCLGGDSDSVACMAGSIAEAFYDGVPENIKRETISYLCKDNNENLRLLPVIQQFEELFGG